MLDIKKYRRKPFDVDAVEVTEDNLHEVAKWCGGSVRTASKGKDRQPAKYVKVRVYSPKNDRQTQAFVGDFVLYAGTGYKVYTRNAFTGTFDELEEGVALEPETVEALLDASRAQAAILTVGGPPGVKVKHPYLQPTSPTAIELKE